MDRSIDENRRELAEALEGVGLDTAEVVPHIGFGEDQTAIVLDDEGVRYLIDVLMGQ